MNIENPNPIKAAGCTPDMFIDHQYSGTPPEILKSIKAMDVMIEHLKISMKDALLIQEGMLDAYAAWEHSFLTQSEITSKLSDQFNATYGFTPESLRTVWLNRRREKKWET